MTTHASAHSMPARARASVLLEVVLALALLAVAGSAVLSAAGRGERMTRRARIQEQGADLARSALAAIEAGLATPQNIGTLVRDGGSGEGGGTSGPRLELDPDSAGEPGQGAARWMLDVQAELSTFDGLSLITITASRGEPVEDGSVYTLRQLVRLVEDVPDRPDSTFRTGAPGREPRP